MKTKKYLLLIAVIMTVASCSTRGIPSCIEIVPPQIQLTGEKTALERQIIGEYEELEPDAWIISSVATNIQKETSEGFRTTGDSEMFEAIKIRQLNRDLIRDYKDEGAIGEGNDGLVKYITVKKYEEDRNLKSMLLKVIEDENRARNIIFRRSLVLSGNPNPTNAQIASFGQAFAAEQSALARQNDWIQNRNGEWVRKR